MFFSFLILQSCKNAPKQKIQSPPVISSINDILGYRLKCKHKELKIDGDLFILSPHIIATWSPDQKNSLEYLRINYIDKKNSPYFESILIGRKNFVTEIRPEGDASNKRIKMEFSDDGPTVTIAHGINPENREPINPIKLKCKKDISLIEYFNTNN